MKTAGSDRCAVGPSLLDPILCPFNEPVSARLVEQIRCQKRACDDG